MLLLDFALHSQMPEVMFHVPGYAKWLADQDMTPAYELHRLLLQVLQWQQPRGRWVLKTPAHLEHLDVLLRVYQGRWWSGPTATRPRPLPRHPACSRTTKRCSATE